MDKTQRLAQLNRHREGPALTEAEIVREYYELYKKPREITPLTNPELFDPLNPPEGWEYDAWHAIWWQPTPESYEFNMWVVRLGALILLCYFVWAAYKIISV